MANFKMTELELKELEREIVQAEKSTSGEIRLIIARRSSVVGHVSTVLTLQLLLLFVAFLQWRLEVLYTLIIVAGMTCIFLLGMGLSKLPVVQRILTNREDLSQQVWNRAVREFYELGMHKTREQTGILIFVSLMERQAVVLADSGIASRLPQDTWEDVIQTALSGSRTGRWQEGLAAAIRECGRLLHDQFPVSPTDRNELTNRVLVKD